MRLKHGRENNTVKDNIILSYKMYQLCIFPAPVIRPFICQLLCSADIAYGCIKPYIQHFTFCIRQRHFHTPVAVAGHGAALQPVIQPAFALPVYIIFPVLMLFQYPLLQPGLIILQREVPVFGLSFYRHGITERAVRIDQLLRRKAAAAFLTLVAVCIGIPANRAGTRNIPVGKKNIRFFIKILLCLFFLKQSFIIQISKEIGRSLMVHRV